MGGLARRLRRLRRDDGGAVLTIWALALPVIVGFLGLGIEVGLWYAEERHAQSGADAAALAAAIARAGGAASDDIAANARQAAAAAAIDPTVDVVTVNAPPTAGGFVADPSAVEIFVTKRQPRLFSSLFAEGDVDIRSRAVAVAGRDNEYCLIGLDPAVAGAVTIGGTAGLNSPNCGIAANSASAAAFTVTGTTQVAASTVTSVGGQSIGANVAMEVAQRRSQQQPVADPYADLTVPGVAACDHNNYASGKVVATIAPGTYCGGLAVTAHAEITMAPGLYVIDGGSFAIDGQATLRGTDVTIVLTGSGANYATVSIKGGATVDLKAPVSGAWAGVLFFQDPAAPSTLVSELEGGSSTSFQGALYFPTQQLEFAGGNATSGACIQIIARKAVITGNSAIGNDCVDKGVRMAGRLRPALVE